MLARTTFTALFAAFALSACQGGTGPLGNGDNGNGNNDPQPVIVTADGQELFAGDTVAANSVLPPSDCLDYRAQFRLLDIEATDSNGLLDRVVWNQAVDRSFDDFQQPLSALFDVPFQAFDQALQQNFEVQADGTLVFTKQINVNGQPVELKVVLDPNDDFTAGTAQFFLDNVLRFEISGDFKATNVNISVFDAAGVEKFNVVFTRNAANFNVVFTNLETANKFTVDFNAGNLLVERDEQGDGFGNENGEFQVKVNIATFNGTFSFVAPVLGNVTLPF